MMRVILPLLLLAGLVSAASTLETKPVAEAKTPADSVRTLRIESSIPGSWEQAEWFEEDLEATLNGFEHFEVIPRSRINAFLTKAQIDPARRDSAALDLINAHFPAAFHLQLQVRAPISEAHRTPVLFFIGRRVTRMEVTARLFASDARMPELRGEFGVDTTISTGFCGLVDCIVKHPDVQTRLQMERDLFRRLESKLKARIEEMMVIPVQYKAYQDTMALRRTRDSIGVRDSLAALKAAPASK